jgi:hypothetical protein
VARGAPATDGGKKIKMIWDVIKLQDRISELHTKNAALRHEIAGVVLQAAEQNQCLWELQDDDTDGWRTSCENTFVFNEGDPHNNGFKFCPYCGGQLLQMGTMISYETNDSAT